MRPKMISVTYGRKFNLGDYNSAEIAVTLWADLDQDGPEPEDAEIALRELQAMARDAVKLEYLRTKKPKAD